MFRERLTGRNFFTDTASTSFWVIAGRALAFLVQLMVLILFGVNETTDAFFLAYSILVFVWMVLADTPRTALAPFIAEHEVAERQRSHELLKGVALWALLSSAALMGLIAAALPYWLRWISLWDAAMIARTQGILLLGIPMTLISFVSSYASCLFNYHKHFRFSTGVIACKWGTAAALILATKDLLGILSVLVSITAGELILATLMLVQARRRFGFSAAPAWGPADQLRAFLGSCGPMISAALLVALITVAEKFAAGRLGPGSVSTIQYSGLITYACYGALLIGFDSVLIAYLSNSYARDPDPERLRAEVARRTWQVLSVAVPTVLAVSILAGPITRILLGFARLGAEELGIISDCLRVQVLCLIFWGPILTLNRYFLVLKRTDVLLEAAIIQLLTALLALYLGGTRFGLLGIAMAAPLHTLAKLTFLFFRYRADPPARAAAAQ